MNLTSTNLSATFMGCAFSRQLCEVNNVIYGFSPGGICSFDVSKNPNVESFTFTYSMNPNVVDNLIYYSGDVSSFTLNGSVPRCLNTDNGTITDVAISSWRSNTGVIKGIDGVTYFGCSNGLYYLDTDGLIKNKPLYDLNGTEIVDLPILQFLKDSAGIVYVSGTKNYHQYVFTIDNNSVECIFSLLWDANIKLFASPSGKIYYIDHTSTQLGYIENGVMNTIFNYTSPMSPYVGINEKIYLIAIMNGGAPFVYKNGQFISIDHDEFPTANMQFIAMIPLKFSTEILLFARDVSLLKDVYYIIDPNQNDTYAHLLSSGDIELGEMIETSDGQIYFNGEDGYFAGLWRFNK
jgi:hypothetical protein